MAAMAQVAVLASDAETRRAAATTTSRWLIQICWRPAMPREQGIGASRRSSSVARPYSPLSPLRTVAAQQVRHQLLAVADAQHGPAEAENGGVDGGAGGIVDAAGAAGDDEAARGASSAAGVSLGRTSA